MKNIDILENQYTNIKEGYKVYKIRKKKGFGFRIIEAPNESMLKILNKIKEYIENKDSKKEVFDYSSKNKGIRKNAEVHIGNKYILNIDILKCFLNTKIEMLYNVSNLYEYNLQTLKLGFFMGHLPTGSPSSNLILNIILRDLDNILRNEAAKLNIKYSRYVDDLTFSGNSLEEIKEMNKFAIRSLNSFGYNVNLRKIRLQQKGNKMMVTGLNVDSNRPTVGRKFIKQLKLESKLANKGLLKNKKNFEGKLNFLNDISKEMYNKIRAATNMIVF